MVNGAWRLSRAVLVAGLLACGCLPLRDLDSAAAGPATGGAGGGRGSGGASSTDDVAMGGAADGSDDAVADTGPGAGGVPAAGGASGAPGAGGAGAVAFAGDAGGGPEARDAAGGAIGTGGQGGVSGAGGTSSSLDGGASKGGSGGTSTGPAPDLPDIANSPVQGEITYSAGASWDIDGTQWPAFEVHTPTASYWLVKQAAAIVSIVDSVGQQWINFSSGFRPNRGVPNLGGCCQPGNPAKLGLPTMTTQIDPAFTVTSTHLRLVSKAADESYWLVWDFFLTHVTVTINRAQSAFGFTYRGVPGGSLTSTDRLVLSSGASQSATVPWTGDLPGTAEWAYLSDPTEQESLFLIQHTGDNVPESYQIADGDSAMFVFGGGHLTQTPVRFSLGLINAPDDKSVRDRITFVVGATP